MKPFRLFAAALLAFSIVALAPAQETEEFQALRAKAEKGNGIAQYNLGLAYAEGRGVPADRLEAYVWLSLARQNGARGRALDNLVATFDKSTFETAQRMLAERKASPGSRELVAPAPTITRTTPTPAPVTSPAAKPDTPAGPTADTSALNKVIETLNVDKRQLSSEVAQAWKEIEGLKADLAKNQRDTAAVSAELTRTRQNLTALQQAPKPTPDTSALDKKTRELQAATAELENLGKFGRELEASLGRLNDEKAALQQQLGSAQAAAGQLTSTQADLARTKSDLAEQTQKNSSQIQALNGQLAESQQKLTELQARATSSGQTVAQLKSTETELAQMRANREQLTTSVQKLTEEKSSLEKKLAANEVSSSHLRELESSLASAQTELKASTTTKATLAAASAKAATAEQQLAKLQSDLAAAKTLMTGLTAERDTARQGQNELGAALAKLEQEKNRLLAAQTPSSETTRQLKELSDKAASTEKQAATLRQERDGLTTKLAALTEETTRLKDERERMQKLIADSGRQLRDSAASAARSKELETQNAKLQGSITRLEQEKAQLAAAPSYPDLSGRVGELEARLSSANQKVEATNQAAGNVNQQMMANLSASAAQILHLQTELANKPSGPSYPDLSDKVHELETKLSSANEQASAAARATTAANQQNATELKTAMARIAQLETVVTNARKPVSPAYPDLSSKVRELEGRATDTTRELAAATATQTDLQKQLADAKTSLQAANKTKGDEAQLRHERDELSGRLASLTSETAQLRADRERMQKLIADAAKHQRDASTDATRIKNLEGEVVTLQAAVAARPAGPAYPDLSGKVHELEAQLTTAAETATATNKQTSTTLTAAATKANQLEAALVEARKPVAPAYPDLSGKVRELETKLAASTENATAADKQSAIELKTVMARTAQLEAALAEARKPVPPAYADLSSQVHELESKLAATTEQASAAVQAATATNKQNSTELKAATTRTAQLESALAEARKPVAPAYPDLSGKVSELQGKLAVAEKNLAEKPATPSYPNLSGQVHDLEAKLAATNEKASTATVAAAAATKKIAQLEASLVEARKPVAPAYPDLAGKVTELQGKLSVAEKSLAEKPATPSYPNLSGQVHDLEAKLAATNEKASAATLAAGIATAKIVQLEAGLVEARKPVAPAYPDLAGKVHDLESQLVTAREQASAATQTASAASKQNSVELKTAIARTAQLESALAEARKPVASAYPDLSGKVRELQGKLALAEKNLAEKPAAPSYPDLSGHVNELETALAGSSKQVVTLTNEEAALKQQLADTSTALKESKSKNDLAPLRRERDELSTRLVALTGETTQLRTDRERMQKLLADSGKQLRDSASDASRIKELEAQSTSQHSALISAQAQVASLQASLAEKNAAPVHPDLSGKVTELETKLVAANQQAESAVQTATTVSRQSAADLTAASEQIAQLKTALAAKPAAAAYPDLTANVRELDRQVTIANERAVAATQAAAETGRRSAAELNTATAKIAQLETALAEARQPVAPAYPDLSAKVSELQGQLALAQKAVSEKPAAPAYPDLTANVRELDRQVTIANERAVAATKAAAETGKRNAAELNTATAKIAQLETALAEARQPTAPAYPDLSGKVRELQGQLTLAEKTAAEKPAAPAYPDLSGRVKELEDQLAAAPKTRGPSYPNLAGRVSELQNALADTKRDLADAQTALRTAEQTRVAAAPAPAAAPDASVADLKKQLAASEDKLATALRGYAVLQRNQETQAASVAKSATDISAERDKLATQVASLTAEVEQLKAGSASQTGSAQTEIARLNETLGALQRSTGKNTSDLAATRALLQQVQGSNAVLASENYQLKTRLAGGTPPAAVSPAPASAATPTPLPAIAPARTHVVVAGDSLSKISQRYYGTPTRWQEIFRANRDKISSTGVLRVGLELRIP